MGRVRGVAVRAERRGMMELLDRLIGYATAGAGVLPLHWPTSAGCSCRRDCASPAKHPLTRHGKDDASLDANVIEGWIARWPTANWGIRPPAGVVILDVDPRNGGDVELAALEVIHGKLPDTLTARTGSGGSHIWLTHNGTSRGKLCTGVDVKTSTGYVVAPPSLHVAGGRYTWVNQCPADYAPRWVATILNPPVRRCSGMSTGGARLDALVQFVLDSAVGERNRRLFWAACRACESGQATDPLIDAAVSVGLPEPAARATVRSAQRAPLRGMSRSA